MEDQKTKFFNKIFVLSAVLVAGILLFLAGQMLYQTKLLDQQNSNQITVSGQGKVYAKPDIAVVSLGFTATGKTVAEVTKSSSEKMNAVIEAVKALSVEEKDIQTTTYNLSPTYNYTEKAGRVFEGYTLQQNIEVKIRDFTKIGDILAQTTAKGANLVGDLKFTIDEPEQFKQEARAKAIEKAKANAQKLAQDSGVRLGKLINIYENSNAGSYAQYTSAKMLGAGVMEDLASTPTIQSGEQEIQITVNLTYQVR